MKWDIYFCGSIRAGRQDAEVYQRLIEKLKKYGTVLTEFVGTIKDIEEEGKDATDEEIHNRDMRLLEQADVVVAEVTQPSLGVGYEIGRAMVLQKPILCLYRPSPGKHLSSLIRGIHDGQLVQTVNYQETDSDSIFQDFFSQVEQAKDRFGCMDSPKRTG